MLGEAYGGCRGCVPLVSDSSVESVVPVGIQLADGDKQKVMHLDGEEFVRRFLLHFLPKGLMRIRHYGFLANRTREVKLGRIRQALSTQATAPTTGNAGEPPLEARIPCTKCKQGTLRVIGEIAPRRCDGMSPFC
jgi:hypothetical protein